MLPFLKRASELLGIKTKYFSHLVKICCQKKPPKMKRYTSDSIQEKFGKETSQRNEQVHNHLDSKQT